MISQRKNSLFDDARGDLPPALWMRMLLHRHIEVFTQQKHSEVSDGELKVKIEKQVEALFL